MGKLDKSTRCTRRILFIPDTHRPYHDERAWQLMLTVARWWRPATLVILGDFADFYSVSDHDKNPLRARNLQDELPIVHRGLDELDSLGALRKYYVSGNHEWRLDKYLAKRAPELIGLGVDIKSLLGLRERGWRFTPYMQTLRLGRLNITHDVGHSGKYAVHQTGAAFEGNVVFGHTHRMGVHYFGNAKGESHVAASFGWLGSANAIDYLHGTRVNRDWQLGFGLGAISPRGLIGLTAMPIVGYRAFVGDKLFIG